MMKQILIVMMLMCGKAAMTTATAQQTQGDSTQVTALAADSTGQDEVEAFSDTTQTDTSGVVSVTQVGNSQFPFDDEDFISTDSLFENFDFMGLAGMGFVLLILLILFVLAPVLIIALILYFVYKNRKQRMRLAEMAIKNGQPIPQELVDTPKAMDGDLRARGIRQAALGIGLTCFLGWLIGDVGAGIGILVLCIGLGNLVIARNAQKQRENLTDADFDRRPTETDN